MHNILPALGEKVINVGPNDDIGTLVEVTLDGSTEKFLKFKCDTGRKFAQAVPPDVMTAQEAQNWIWQGDYKPDVVA